ncbi:hypothetical protein ACLOJK_010605 [Asimina triloba]
MDVNWTRQETESRKPSPEFPTSKQFEGDFHLDISNVISMHHGKIQMNAQKSPNGGPPKPPHFRKTWLVGLVEPTLPSTYQRTPFVKQQYLIFKNAKSLERGCLSYRLPFPATSCSDANPSTSIPQQPPLFPYKDLNAISSLSRNPSYCLGPNLGSFQTEEEEEEAS